MRISFLSGFPGLLALLFSSMAMSQSVSVIGGSEQARECFFAAQIAVQMNSSSRSEILTCTNALQTENMNLRDKAATYINRGILHVALEEYKLAIADYARAEKLYPGFGAIHVNRGNLYFISQAYDGAIDEYNKALSVGLKQESVAYLNRGMAYEKLGRLQEAKTDYLQAINLSPEWVIPQSKLERVTNKLN